MKFDPAMTKNEHVKQAKDGLDVWDDIHRYAKTGFASIDPDDFARMRWFGIYQQKPDEGHFMWRIKIPAGRLTPAQLREIGRFGNDHARGFGDITTRQDIQFHWLTIENFPEAFERIYRQQGLYTDFSCGDTPRNVCCCPLAGLLGNEVLDIGDLPKQLSDMFKAGGKEFSNLPRKFKTSISGCPLHCNQPQINDIGAFAVRRRRNGVEERGLGVMVGGGLSSLPHFAQSLRVFIPQNKIAQQIPDIFRHVCHIFRDADELRYKRIRARLKFLVADRGWQWVRDDLERRLGYELEHDDSIANPSGGLHTDHVGTGVQKNGLHYVGVPIERGRWTCDQMIAAADLADRFAAAGQAQIRLSQKQNLLLVNIPKENVDELTRQLEAVGLQPHAPLWRQSLISCTGTQFCNLAVVETKQRAYEILKYLEAEVQLDTPIMLSISGCHNSCAQYAIADIGLTGIKAIFHEEKVDAYDVLVGGSLGDTPEFGQQLVAKCPSSVVHKVIAQLVRNYQTHRITEPDGDVEPFRDFIARHPADQLRKWSEIPDWQAPAPKIKKPRASPPAKPSPVQA